MSEDFLINLPPEGRNVEYKEASNSIPKDLWRTYSAFANTAGGIIILGINDSREVVGVKDHEKILADFWTILHNRQKVSAIVVDHDGVKVTSKNGKTIIIITVLEADYNQKPVYINNMISETYLRTHESNIKASSDELKYLIRNSETEHDAKLLENYGLDDLNIKTLAKYKDFLIRQNPKNEKYLEYNYNEILLELGAIRKDRKDGKEKLTLGGLLFFGKYNSIVEIISHFHLDYQNKIKDPIRWTDRVSSGDVDDINVFEFYVLVLEKLKATVLDSFSLSDDLTRTSMSSDIEISLREALANALIHADYEYNMPVIVEAHKAHYVFKNPGNMKITLEEFARGGKSVPRNNVIITLFRRIGVCERAGTGGPQIYSSAQKNRLRFPDIVSDEFSTSLILWKTDIADSYPGMTGDAKQVMKLLQRSISPLSSSDIRNYSGLSKHFLMKAINELLEAELIYRDGAGSSTKYALNQSSQEHIAQLQFYIQQLQDFHIG